MQRRFFVAWCDRSDQDSAEVPQFEIACFQDRTDAIGWCRSTECWKVTEHWWTASGEKLSRPVITSGVWHGPDEFWPHEEFYVDDPEKGIFPIKSVYLSWGEYLRDLVYDITGQFVTSV